MSNREKYLVIAVMVTLALSTALMIGLMYYDRAFPVGVDFEFEPIERIIQEEEEEEVYDGPEIPELTPGDSIEEIEKDIESLEDEIGADFEALEKEIQELF